MYSGNDDIAVIFDAMEKHRLDEEKVRGFLCAWHIYIQWVYNYKHEVIHGKNEYYKSHCYEKVVSYREDLKRSTRELLDYIGDETMSKIEADFNSDLWDNLKTLAGG